MRCDGGTRGALIGDVDEKGPAKKAGLKPGDVIGVKEKDKTNASITGKFRGKNQKFSWIDWNEGEMKGTFVAYPERESVPENIKEQLIVELYSK